MTDLIKARVLWIIGLIIMVTACIPYGNSVLPNICLAILGALLFAIGNSIERDLA